MDLGLHDRSIWLMLGQSAMAWSLAAACLGEGARVVLFCSDSSDHLRARRIALAARFGLKVRVASCEDHLLRIGPLLAELRLWGGPPAVIVALCEGALLHSKLGGGCSEMFASSLAELRPDGGLVLVEPDWRSRNEVPDNEANLAALQERRLVWRSLAPEGVRVSLVAVPGLFTTPLTSAASGQGEEPLVDLILFLAGRGFGSVASISSDGAIQLV